LFLKIFSLSEAWRLKPLALPCECHTVGGSVETSDEEKKSVGDENRFDLVRAEDLWRTFGIDRRVQLELAFGIGFGFGILE